MTGYDLPMPTPTRPPPSPAPLHAQIREALRERILDGSLRAHDRLPSEHELMEEFGVSRITVRRALGDLEGERVIFRLAGKGSFVSKPTPVQSLARLEGFAEAMGAQGFEIVNRVLSVKRIGADAEVAGRLELPEGAPVTELRRVRLLNRAPVSLDVTWVPAAIGDRLAREDLATRDVFLILENDYGIALGHADLQLDATVADATLARHLRVPRGAPVLHVERLTHTAAGKPLDFEHLYYRGDGFKHRLRIDRTRS